MKSTEVRKYNGHNSDIERAREQVTKVRSEYVRCTIESWDNDNCTPFELKREFFELIAAHNGFTIVWPEAEKGDG